MTTITSRNTRLAVLALALVGCALKKDNEPQEPREVNKAEVHTRQLLYCGLSESAYKSNGWVHSKCDGLLFTSLHALACPYVDITPFQKELGLWKRSPSFDCYAKGESKSGISRDMILGVIFYSWQYNRLDFMEELIAYGEVNDWDMCDGEYIDEATRISRCVMSPTIKATIYEVASKLGYNCDNTCKVARAVPQVWNPHETDFQAHLLNVHILIRGLVQGAINGNQLAQLNWQADRVPENELFLANLGIWKDGDFSKSAILNELYFPSTRLPKSSERCTDYLWQRDPGKDWEPCPSENLTHAGTDFLLVSAIILEELRGQANGPIFD